jgi:hypothetical protein
MEGLESLDVETRVRLIRELGDLPRGPGIGGLLRLLADSRIAETRAAANEVLGPGREIAIHRSSQELVLIDHGPQLVDGLVSAVDGEGRATIGVSARIVDERRSALFACDAVRGITGAVGRLEAESPDAGGLLEEFRLEAAACSLVSSPSLATSLLAGCLWLGGAETPHNVSRWLEAILGQAFCAQPLLIPVPGSADDIDPAYQVEELLDRASLVLEACPDWLDRSALTYDLAREIGLREGRMAADSRRDAGAIRYLFEHRILGRLELYRRMLLWMARYWQCGGEPELARSARVFAVQLLDEQFAVPGHPFVQALATRSLDAAADMMKRNRPKPTGP